jgi:hypothetical protein
MGANALVGLFNLLQVRQDLGRRAKRSRSGPRDPK